MTARPRRLYFDNAATSFPKPPVVIEAMQRFATEIGASPGRGGYRETAEASRILDQCRQGLITLLNGQSPSHVIFTLNATDALNLAIKGIARHHQCRGEVVHIIATHMDHNSILRPLHQLQREGVDITLLPCDPATGLLDPDDLAAAVTPHTRLVATLHGSNVTGTLQPIADIGRICRERDVPFLVDAAQTLGHVPLDVQAMNIDLLAFPGHKGLLGPLGTGGLYIRPDLEHQLDTLREGGTGSISEQPTQPHFLPDKYEPGSHNTIGIAGLNAALQWILARGVDDLWEHEQQCIRFMVEQFTDLANCRLVGPSSLENRCGVFSITVNDWEPAELAAVLEESHNVLTRPGLHCAPLAHRTMNTEQRGGTVRFSLGPFLTLEDCSTCIDAIQLVGAQTTHAGVA